MILRSTRAVPIHYFITRPGRNNLLVDWPWSVWIIISLVYTYPIVYYTHMNPPLINLGQNLAAGSRTPNLHSGVRVL